MGHGKRKKIICIANDTWADSDEKWGFNRMITAGFQVEIWKIGAITIGTKVWDPQPYRIPSVKMKTWKQFYRILLSQDMGKTKFFFFNRYDCLNYAKMIIRIMGGEYYNITINSVVSRSYFENYKKVYEKKFHYMDLFPATYNFLPSEMNKGDLQSSHEAKKKNNIVLHTYNYDCYILTEKHQEENIIENEYILFMDQNLLKHKDLVNFQVGSFVKDEERYVREINVFLNYLETYYGKEVVIAAHPTADEKTTAVYGNRRVVYGNSCQYVKYADVVVSFASSSIDFAVLYDIPILFYFNEDLKDGFLYKDFFLPKVKALKAKVLNISRLGNGVDLDRFLADTKNYGGYLPYITSHKTDRLFIDSVMEYIKK